MLEGNTDILGIPCSFFFSRAHTHKLQLIYFESTDRTIAEGTFILDRAVCLLDIVDGRQSTDVSGLQSLKAQENLRTKGNMWFDLVHCRMCFVSG